MTDELLINSRTPQGVRGLKPHTDMFPLHGYRSHSARSAWIETFSVSFVVRGCPVALRKECVD